MNRQLASCKTRHLYLARTRHSHIALTDRTVILGTYGMVLRWFGFSDFVIFQRVRRPTYPQDIHFFKCFLLR
ncbi:hypothetical protein, partial [Paraburkholderia caribensis]|uniref:hypothetical protein n=1 Tax=Paraburkholderia caribensis TaxID=75105 RepID=UPI0034D2FAF2